ncbi:MAG TPA: hypothetical protein VF791_07315 [Pyrinomonadaceae bacterium]
MKRIIAYISMALLLAAGFFPARALPNIPADTPEQAARQLQLARSECDRAGALKVATPAVVKKLLGKNCRPAVETGAPELEFSGCDRTGNSFLCSFYYEGGAMNMRVRRSGGGFRVVSVGFVAD